MLTISNVMRKKARKKMLREQKIIVDKKEAVRLGISVEEGLVKSDLTKLN